MFAEIITIGDEILIGQIIDSNSAFIGEKLNSIGVAVHQISSIQDDAVHITQALNEAKSRADIIILTGGLGPTKDDITKVTLCDFFNDKLIENKEVLEHVKYLFEKVYAKPISEVNKKQALVPSKAEVLMNEFGTAPGMWIQEEKKVFVSLPGVPYEMKALIENQVLPKIQEHFKTQAISHKTLLTHGMGESAIAERLSQVEDALPDFIKLAYLPSTGRVRLRLSGKHEDEAFLSKIMEEKVLKVKNLVADIFIGFEDEGSIESLLGDLLVKNNATLSLAESCTGGQIAQRITARSGASKYFKGSVVAYGTDVKEQLLNVPRATIEDHSVVSVAVAKAMALGVKERMGTDFAIATTGNAGPTKGDSDAEVGTVCIAVASPNGVFAEEFYFGTNRERVVNKAVNTAFELLQKEILKN